MIREQFKTVENYPIITIPLTFVNDRVRTALQIDTQKHFSDAFIPLLVDQTAIQIYYGGAGGGKSVSIARRTILDMMAGKRNFLIVRKVHGTLKDSFYAELKKATVALGLHSYFKFTVSPLEITCKRTGRKAVFRGMDDHEKVKSVTVDDGIITDVIVEEATELSEQDYDLLDTRLRGACEVSKRITLLFNPIHQEHWLFKRFFAGKFPDNAVVAKYEIEYKYVDYSLDSPAEITGTQEVVIHKSTHWENNFLMNEDHSKYESFKYTNQYLYDVYTCGNWGVLGDLIFTNYAIRDLTKVAKSALTFEYGMDLGWSPDPYSFVVCAIRGSKIYIFREQGGTLKTSREIKKEITPLLKDNVCYCESADGRTFGELEALGMGENLTKVAKWPDNNSHSIQFCQNYEIIIDYRCVEFISEIKSYAWQKDKNGVSIRKPVDKNDHYIQAMFYALNTKINSYRETYIGR
ncbi:MAG: PBSX family phage terminase large subunit [Euryarchaeota archaeon]|nr:PBSX family phage terminase large subunit [Euryarchaeota archaeon]